MQAPLDYKRSMKMVGPVLIVVLCQSVKSRGAYPVGELRSCTSPLCRRYNTVYSYGIDLTIGL